MRIRLEYQGQIVGEVWSEADMQTAIIMLAEEGITARPLLIDWQAHCISKLNSVAEEQRQKYLPAPGQALTYMEKEKQARAYAAAGYTGPVPPLVQAEVDAGLAPDARAAADAIIAAADRARTALTAIEAERRKGVAAIRAATDQAGVDAALQAAIQRIQAL